MADQAASIFNDGSQTPANQQQGGSNTPNVNSPDNLATLLGTIKNERGEPKYKTVEDALKALQHSQEFIPTLKQTKEELEQKLNAAVEKLSKMDQLEQTVLELTQRNSSQAPTNQPVGMSEEQVAELVARTLTKTQQQAIQKENLTTVATAVKTKFGDKAEEVFYGKAQELGMTIEEFNTLAARTPKAVLKLVGIEEQQTQKPQSNTPSFNTAGFQPAQNTFIGRNPNRAMVGATSDDIKAESQNARKMVEELHSQGLTVYDLTDPKVYRKHFAR